MANKKEPTLLEKAMMTRVGPKRNHVVTDEEVDLAIAWLNGEISTRQGCDALGCQSHNNVNALSSLVSRCIRDGFINKVTRNGK